MKEPINKITLKDGSIRLSALTLFPRGFDQVIPQVLAVLLFYLPLVFPVGTTRAGLLFGR